MCALECGSNQASGELLVRQMRSDRGLSRSTVERQDQRQGPASCIAAYVHSEIVRAEARDGNGFRAWAYSLLPPLAGTTISDALCDTLCPLWFRFFLGTDNWILIMREVISTKDAPQAIGPYSQAIKANGFVFVSGQVAIDPANQQVVAGDVAAQTDRVLRNLSEILEAAGSGLGKVVRSTVFLKNMNDFAAMNAVYGKYFSSTPPARSTVEVARLPKDVLVEIDVMALA